MIAKRCFTEAGFQRKREELKNVDIGLLERAVHAFALLGHLSESGLDFVFKGGTSLILHAPEIRRLSIDIDILCKAPAEELERAVAEVAGRDPFIRFEEDDRGARGLPNRRHFKLFYNPVVPGDPSHILLDVVEEPEVPHDIIQKPIAPAFLDIDREIMVNIPTVESLLADKLSAFAPYTTGVPFKPKNGSPPDTMQIVKQLFDVGELFSLAEDLDAVRNTYRKVFEQEKEYRGGGFSLEDALADTLDTSFMLSINHLKGAPKENPSAVILEDGISRLRSHLVNYSFNRDEAKVAAAKAALLTRLITSEGANPSIAHWREMPDMKDLKAMSIEGAWHWLDRLKAIIPDGFYYWYQASRLQAGALERGF